jgi:endonuclease/exonuclease/phosphatase family metal-dependent hydrolase
MPHIRENHEGTKTRKNSMPKVSTFVPSWLNQHRIAPPRHGRFTLQGETMPRLRLLTFNIAHGRGLAPISGFTSRRKIRANLLKIAHLLQRLEPDIVALQEIDECSRWAGNFDHLEYLRLHAGYPYSVFGINNRRTGLLNFCYGNAILSRHPIVESETVVFGRRRVGEKGFLFVELDVAGRRVPLVNLHLHYRSRERRFVQTDRLLAWLREKQRQHHGRWSTTPIVCGDLNNPGHRSDATAALLSHLSDYGDYALHPLTGRTFPSPLPGRLLDFVFLPAGCIEPKSEIVRCFLSDHRPVRVDFSIA